MIAPGTPLPWNSIEKPDGQCTIGKESAAQALAIVLNQFGAPKGNAVKDAAYIVHACNIYPELVEALARLCREADELDRVGLCEAFEQAQAALAKAGAA